LMAVDILNARNLSWTIFRVPAFFTTPLIAPQWGHIRAFRHWTWIFLHIWVRRMLSIFNCRRSRRNETFSSSASRTQAQSFGTSETDRVLRLAQGLPCIFPEEWWWSSWSIQCGTPEAKAWHVQNGRCTVVEIRRRFRIVQIYSTSPTQEGQVSLVAFQVWKDLLVSHPKLRSVQALFHSPSQTNFGQKPPSQLA
jgi:hypothetical protein